VVLPVDEVLRALADPHRRRIVEQLGDGQMSVSALATPLPMSLPAVMQHLAVLERCGLVESTKQGRVRTCRLRRAALGPLEDWLSARRADWERRLDELAVHLGEGSGA